VEVLLSRRLRRIRRKKVVTKNNYRNGQIIMYYMYYYNIKLRSQSKHSLLSLLFITVLGTCSYPNLLTFTMSSMRRNENNFSGKQNSNIIKAEQEEDKYKHETLSLGKY
jgi:hypothetical protein